MVGCTKSEPEPNVNQWEYVSNVNGGCSSLIGTTMTFDGKNGIVESVPTTIYLFAKQDTLYKNVMKVATNSYTTEKALTKFAGGAIRYAKANIVISSDGKSMEITYPNLDVCNPSQIWKKK